MLSKIHAPGADNRVTCGLPPQFKSEYHAIGQPCTQNVLVSPNSRFWGDSRHAWRLLFADAGVSFAFWCQEVPLHADMEEIHIVVVLPCFHNLRFKLFPVRACRHGGDAHCGGAAELGGAGQVQGGRDRLRARRGHLRLSKPLSHVLLHCFHCKRCCTALNRKRDQRFEVSTLWCLGSAHLRDRQTLSILRNDRRRQNPSVNPDVQDGTTPPGSPPKAAMKRLGKSLFGSANLASGAQMLSLSRGMSGALTARRCSTAARFDFQRVY